ncbi:MAG: hypothetical protein V4586_03435 [Pseudomonadota bacterium]
MHEQEIINRALVSAAVADEMGFSYTAEAFLKIVADVAAKERKHYPHDYYKKITNPQSGD